MGTTRTLVPPRRHVLARRALAVLALVALAAITLPVTTPGVAADAETRHGLVEGERAVALADPVDRDAVAQTAPPGTASGRHLRPDGHISLAWLYGGSSAEYRAQVEQAFGLTTISPTWWYLDRSDPGALELSTDDGLVAWAHERGLAVWPLLGNHIDPDLTDQVLRDPALRARLVDGVVAETRRSGVDGVNVDFENLHDETRFLLTDLVAELKAAMPDLVISVDVTAMTDTWVLDNWSTAFDREGLGRVADYVMLMAYDQHNSLRRDGPVAGLTWVTESTDFLLRTVPAEKVVLGLPLYSRDWATDPSARDGVDLDATLGMAAMARRMAERSSTATYDPEAGQDLHTYTDAQGRPHRVWLEDVASLQRKTALVGSRGLAGIAAWRAGFEQPEVWTALDAQLATIPPPGSSAAGPGGTAAAPVEPAPAQPATDQPSTDQPSTDQPSTDQPSSGQAATGTTPDGTGPADRAEVTEGLAPDGSTNGADRSEDPGGAPPALAGGSTPTRSTPLMATAAGLLATVLLAHAAMWRRRPRSGSLSRRGRDR